MEKLEGGTTESTVRDFFGSIKVCPSQPQLPRALLRHHGARLNIDWDCGDRLVKSETDGQATRKIAHVPPYANGFLIEIQHVVDNEELELGM